MTEQPGPYGVVKGGASPTKRIEAKLRIEEEKKEDIDAIIQRLRQVMDVIEESRDYPKRRGFGMIRYLTRKNFCNSYTVRV